MVWAFSLSLATTQEIIIIFSSSAYLDVSVQQVCAFMRLVFNQPGFPIQKSTDQFIFADPRSLSQLITSFIASESQGIPRVPFLTFFYYTAFCPVCMLLILVVIRILGFSEQRARTEVFFPFSFHLSSKANNRLYCCLLFFSITSSNMSKNFTPTPKGAFALYPCPFRGPGGLWRITDSKR